MSNQRAEYNKATSADLATGPAFSRWSGWYWKRVFRWACSCWLSGGRCHASRNRITTNTN